MTNRYSSASELLSFWVLLSGRRCLGVGDRASRASALRRLKEGGLRQGLAERPRRSKCDAWQAQTLSRDLFPGEFSLEDIRILLKNTEVLNSQLKALYLSKTICQKL